MLLRIPLNKHISISRISNKNNKCTHAVLCSWMCLKPLFQFTFFTTFLITVLSFCDGLCNYAAVLVRISLKTLFLFRLYYSWMCLKHVFICTLFTFSISLLYFFSDLFNYASSLVRIPLKYTNRIPRFVRKGQIKTIHSFIYYSWMCLKHSYFSAIYHSSPQNI